MKVRIFKSEAKGKVYAPPSKSVAHRALICGALSEKSSIHSLAFSKDIEATLGCLKALGAQATKTEKVLTIGALNPLDPNENATLFCNESGSTLRFMLPLCMLSDKKITLTGSERLFSRPLTVYEEIAEQNGILFEKTKNSVTVCGKLKAGNYKVRGDISSQFISGLLFALPLLDGDSRIEITHKFESASYIDITLSALKTFGIEIKRQKNTFYITGNQRYRGCDYTVEGDFSNAAFLDGFNVLGGSVSVEGLNPESQQGDRVYKQIYSDLLRGKQQFDLSDCPDLAPVLFALASQFGAEFTGTQRLKIKESDRAQAMREELLKVGVEALVFENSVRVKKSELKAPTEAICSHNDHRIVMAMALLLTKTGGAIEGAQAVEKSFPDFFETIKKLGIEMEIYED